MTTPMWDPGRLYAPGALVVPRSNAPVPWPALGNPGFETPGLDDWDLILAGAGSATNGTGRPYTGSRAGRWLGNYGGPGPGGGTNVVFLAKARGRVRAGQMVTVSAMFAQDDTRNSANFGKCRIYWYRQDDSLIRFDESPNQVAGNYSHYERNSVTKPAPGEAHYARAGFWCNANGEGGMWVDDCSWSSNAPAATAGLQYKAVQPATGYSNTSEPAWPGVVGEQVIDNEVIWEAVLLTRVVWKARPILKSGSVEPTWIGSVGAMVPDNTINWEAISRRVTDPKCPNSKYVVIAASKLFAADNDIIRYSATVNGLDWSSANDAGYLPFGLQLYGANPVRAMGLYRGNVVPLNSQGGQVWQVDEDPESMALLDAFPIGSQYHHAMAPVSNDLVFLSPLGVRSIGIAAGSTNLQAGDIGAPIDPLVQAALDVAREVGIDPIATYYPSQGQYWLAFPGFPEAGQTTCFVLTMNTGKGKWSRYVFPYAIEAFAQLGDDLYIRSRNMVSVVDKDIAVDDTSIQIIGDGGTTRESEPFPGTVWWPYLDLGQAGVTKMLEGVDVIAGGQPSVSIGYDQRDMSMFTEPYEIPADTLPGGMIPIAVSAPTLSIRVDFAPGQAWQLQAVNVFLSDHRLAV